MSVKRSTTGCSSSTTRIVAISGAPMMASGAPVAPLLCGDAGQYADAALLHRQDSDDTLVDAELAQTGVEPTLPHLEDRENVVHAAAVLGRTQHDQVIRE